MSLLRLGKENWARTSPTKEGLTFIGLSFIVGFAAINTANNLLYLIFGIMLSLVIISGIISMLNLSRIGVSLIQISDIYAFTPSSLLFSLKNDKFFLPAFSLTLQLDNNSSFLAYLPAGKTKNVEVGCFFKKRGINVIPGIILYTKFPFGFFKKWIKVDIAKKDVLVYPKIFKTQIDAHNNKDLVGETESIKSGHGEELQTIRKYVDGDITRNIHWKSTAKRNSLMVKQNFQDESRMAQIVFNPKSDNFRDLEHYISEKASLLMEYIKQGFKVDFITNDKIFRVGNVRNELSQALRYLALY